MKNLILNLKKIVIINMLIVILFLSFGFNDTLLQSKTTIINDTEIEEVKGINSSNAVSTIVIGWEFDSDDNGWHKAPHNINTSWDSGSLVCTTKGEADPFVKNIKPQSFSAKNVNFIQFRIKNNTASKIAQFILIKNGGGIVAINAPITPDSNDYQTVVFDLSKIATWDNSLEIDDVRIDANNNGAAGTISYDFIRFTSTSTL